MANKTDALVQEMPVARAPSTGIHSRFVVAGGLKTHFLEPGSGFPVVLLHSGEFAACAELSWKQTIRPPAEHFRVIAPDWAGFGKTEKDILLRRHVGISHPPRHPISAGSGTRERAFFFEH